MPEEVILVDQWGRPMGYEEKLRAHQNGGRLHRAFSIFIYNAEGEMLLQRRSRKKYHFAVHRRLRAEFGFDTELIEAFRFIYRSHDVNSGLTEHEFDHVFIGQFDGEPEPNPEEVDDWKWIDPAALRVDLEENPERYTPWFRLAIGMLAPAALKGGGTWKVDPAPAR
jgi:isopentenyl-diphosphate delta-isomerase